jgi:parallel beta-helix repeat protein
VIEHNHYRGIDLWSVSESTIAHNEILDNGGDWDGNGIFDEAADDMNGNGVTDGDGMTWVYVSDSTATHNTINGNSEVGLSLNQATYNTVTHNDVRKNDNLGIALFGWGAPTTGNTFVWNDARGNPAWDILCYTLWGSMVYGNKWIKNQYDDASPIPLV